MLISHHRAFAQAVSYTWNALCLSLHLEEFLSSFKAQHVFLSFPHEAFLRSHPKITLDLVQRGLGICWLPQNLSPKGQKLLHSYSAWPGAGAKLIPLRHILAT